ncbi:MAG: GNAT family N-acetyltransferase [Oscillospiraceae bacterium]|jgi:hypothetical protein|nr:GNAT family N-acetyltransferase [Oscillospiraceae bacterium]
MYKIDNARMSELFRADGETRHYYACHNIANAGKPWCAIKSVEFYTDERDTPKLEYAEFVANIFGELSVFINTADDALIDDVCRKIVEIHAEYERVSIETPSRIDLSVNGTVRRYFDLSNIYEIELGVYGLLSADKVPPLAMPDDVTVHAASPDEIETIKSLDLQEWGGIPMMLSRVFDSERDLLFLLYFGGQLAGALAANCQYENICDIVTVFVHERFRNRHFATLLTVYFARHCLSNGLYPHYGTAANAESEKVAVNSGFEETARNHSFDVRYTAEPSPYPPA